LLSFRYETLLAGRDSDRQKIDVLQKQLADNEADLNLFRRRLGRFFCFSNRKSSMNKFLFEKNI